MIFGASSFLVPVKEGLKKLIYFFLPKFKEKRLFYAFFVLILSVFLITIVNFYYVEKYTKMTEASSSDPFLGYAWSSNAANQGVGWISFNNCDTFGVCGPIDYGINTTYDPAQPLRINLTGYAWSGDSLRTNPPPAGFGWLKFGGLAGFPVDADNVQADAYIDLTGLPFNSGPQEAPIYGWARFCAGAANPATCLGGTNSTAGGWDGWVQLRGSNFGLKISDDPITNKCEIMDWAWGGTDAGSFGEAQLNANAGWISFNSANANSGGGNYKVEIDPQKFLFGISPFLENEWIDAAYKRATTSQFERFQWRYRELCSRQDGYEIQVSEDPTFASGVIVDSACTGDSGPNYTGSPISVCCVNGGECSNLWPPGESTSFVGPNGWDVSRAKIPLTSLNLDTHYYWRARTKADPNKGGVKSWSYWSDSDLAQQPPRSFDTPPSYYPIIDFEWIPLKPALGQQTTFVDKSICFSGVNPRDCSSDVYGDVFDWTFQSSAGLQPTPLKGTAHTSVTAFNNQSDQYAWLRVQTPGGVCATGLPWQCPVTSTPLELDIATASNGTTWSDIGGGTSIGGSNRITIPGSTILKALPNIKEVVPNQ